MPEFRAESRTESRIPSRQHACTNNLEYRQRAATISSALAAFVGDDPRVAAWQLDNEFTSHVRGCHCATCRGLWTEWLRASYRSIDELNDLWQTTVWSETYQSFGQVPLPGPTPPAEGLAFATERTFGAGRIILLGSIRGASTPDAGMGASTPDGRTAGGSHDGPACRLLTKETAATDHGPVVALPAGTHELEPYGYAVLEEITEETNR